MGKWKSRYPGCYVAFPTRDDLLEYEVIKLENEE